MIEMLTHFLHPHTRVALIHMRVALIHMLVT
jgi:hypothetical protein